MHEEANSEGLTGVGKMGAAIAIILGACSELVLCSSTAKPGQELGRGDQATTQWSYSELAS